MKRQTNKIKNKDRKPEPYIPLIHGEEDIAILEDALEEDIISIDEAVDMLT